MKMIQNKLIRTKHFTNVLIHNFSSYWKINWLKYIVIIFAGFIISQKDVDFQLKLKNSQTAFLTNNLTSQLNTDSFTRKTTLIKTDKIKQNPVLISNNKLSKKDKSNLDYINTYSELAKIEMQKYNIPASITLAQGILETNAGKSKLAKECKNHFGIKCFSKKCKKGHCLNFNDDTHKDFFRKYNSVEESYRAHSHFLKKTRYKKLFQLNKMDYKSWCYELKNAGYATDEKYPEKLIHLIEKYELYKFDE